MNRKEKEFFLRKELIIDAAKQLFIENGFENTTMDDIAKKAEYTKPTLYKYFKNKEEILFGLYLKGWQESVDVVLSEMENVQTGFDKLVIAANTYCDYFRKNSVYFMLLNYVHSNAIKLNDDNSEKKENHKKQVDEFIGKMESIINDGIEDKSIYDGLDVKLAVEYFLNNLYVIMHNFYRKYKNDENYIEKSIEIMMRTFK